MRKALAWGILQNKYLTDKPIGYLLLAALLLSLGFFYARNQINLLPQGIHEWAQADRLAIGMSYASDGGGFWTTRTYSMMPVDRRVGVEWQVQGYLAGQAGKIWGLRTVSPVYRSLTLIFCVLGLAFWGWIVGRMARSWLAGLLICIWLLSSPDLLYYLANYLNEPFALGLVLTSMAVLWLHHRTPKSTVYICALSVATLAVLVRPHAGAYWIAVLLYPILSRWFSGRWTPCLSVYFALCLASIAAFAAQFYYIKWVTHAYNSHVFASGALPFDEWQQVKDALKSLRELWLPEFFEPIQYLVFGLIILFGLGLATMGKHKPKPLSAAWGLAAFGGVLGMIYLFGIQLKDHDYYYLSIVFPLLFSGLGWAWTRLVKWRSVMVWLLFLPLPYLVYRVDVHHQARIKHVYKFWSDRAIIWTGIGEWLEQYSDYQSDKPILVLNEITPNLALIYIGKPGLTYHTGYDRFYKLDTLISRNHLTYALIADEGFTEPETTYPCLAGRLTLLQEGNGFRLYRIEP